MKDFAKCKMMKTLMQSKEINKQKHMKLLDRGTLLW